MKVFFINSAGFKKLMEVEKKHRDKGRIELGELKGGIPHSKIREIPRSKRLTRRTYFFHGYTNIQGERVAVYKEP